MKVKCMSCGQEVEISKLHKDYMKLAADPKAAFVCESCSGRIRHDARQKKAKEEQR